MAAFAAGAFRGRGEFDPIIFASSATDFFWWSGDGGECDCSSSLFLSVCFCVFCADWIVLLQTRTKSFRSKV